MSELVKQFGKYQYNVRIARGGFINILYDVPNPVYEQRYWIWQYNVQGNYYATAI